MACKEKIIIEPEKLDALRKELIHVDPGEILFSEEQKILYDIISQCKKINPIMKLIESDELSLNIGLLGSFSSGKSSILNSLINQDLLPINISPTTAFITKLRYGSEPMKYIVLNDSKRIPISDEQYDFLKKYQTDRAMGDPKKLLNQMPTQVQDINSIKFIEIELPHILLKKINFYDTPGLESPFAGDTDKMIEILKELDLIFWVLDIEQGSLGAKVCTYLKENIKNHLHVPIALILNKVDRKPESAWKEIANHISNEEYQFDIIFPYSAKRVLEFRKTEEKYYNRFGETLENIKKYKYEKSEDFQQNIKNFRSYIEGSMKEISDEYKNETKEIETYNSFYKWLTDYINDLRQRKIEIKKSKLDSEIEGLIKKRENVKEKIKINIDNLKDRLSAKEDEFNKLKKKFNTKIEKIFNNKYKVFRDHIFRYFKKKLFNIKSKKLIKQNIKNKEKLEIFKNFEKYINEFDSQLSKEIFSLIKDNEKSYDHYDELILKLSEIIGSKGKLLKDNSYSQEFSKMRKLLQEFFIESAKNGVMSVYRTIKWSNNILQDIWDFNDYDLIELEEELIKIIDLAISDEIYFEKLKLSYKEQFDEIINMQIRSLKKAEDKIKKLEEVMNNG